MKRTLTMVLLFVGCCLAARAPAPDFSPCDVNQDGVINIADYYYEDAQLLANTPAPAADVNGDGAYNVADLQIVIVAVLGGGCMAGK
jgi:hypothetical protein